MSNTYPPPPPPPGGQDPQQPWGQQGGQAPPPPPPAYGQDPAGSVPPPAAYPQQGAYSQQQGGYGAMPGAPMPGAPAAPVTRPASIDTAVKVMQAGAALSVVSAVVAFLLREEQRRLIDEWIADRGLGSAPASSGGGAGQVIVSALIGVALWLWMARANGAGKSWARIVGTVLFGINVVLTLFTFAIPQPMIVRLLSILTLAVGAAAIYFMYRRESSQYYQAMSRPKY